MGLGKGSRSFLIDSRRPCMLSAWLTISPTTRARTTSPFYPDIQPTWIWIKTPAQRNPCPSDLQFWARLYLKTLARFVLSAGKENGNSYPRNSCNRCVPSSQSTTPQSYPRLSRRSWESFHPSSTHKAHTRVAL